MNLFFYFRFRLIWFLFFVLLLLLQIIWKQKQCLFFFTLCFSNTRQPMILQIRRNQIKTNKNNNFFSNRNTRCVSVMPIKKQFRPDFLKLIKLQQLEFERSIDQSMSSNLISNCFASSNVGNRASEARYIPTMNQSIQYNQSITVGFNEGGAGFY